MPMPPSNTTVKKKTSSHMASQWGWRRHGGRAGGKRRRWPGSGWWRGGDFGAGGRQTHSPACLERRNMPIRAFQTPEKAGISCHAFNCYSSFLAASLFCAYATMSLLSLPAEKMRHQMAWLEGVTSGRRAAGKSAATAPPSLLLKRAILPPCSY